MARDNRKENRANAKENANENKSPTGFELEDMIADETDDENVEEIDTGDNTNDENENASGSETGGEKAKEPPLDVDTDENETDEEEAKKAEADAKIEADEAAKAAEVATGEKTAEELAKEAEEKAKAEPIKAEPTAEQLAATEAAKKAAEEAKEKEAPKTLSDTEATALFTEWRGETEKLLAEHHYRLTDEDVAQLNENPAAYIPKAMSRVYLDCISASFQQFVNYLPRMVHQVLEVREANSKQENQFFSAWPQLKDHRETVLRLGAAYRQSNPAASMEDFVNEVGAQSMVALRLVPKTTNGNAETANGDKKTTFKPAIGSPAGGPQKQAPTNPFEKLAQEFGMELEEDVDDS